jgi:hypothetical protein
MVLNIKVVRKGVDLNILAGKLRDAFTIYFVAGLADFAVERMLANVPWRTGFLASGIKQEVREGTFTVRPTAPYAACVEKGTAPHLILPLNSSCLALTPAGGNTVFTAFAFHPGTKANPFVERTAAEVRANVGRVFSEVWTSEVENG